MTQSILSLIAEIHREPARAALAAAFGAAPIEAIAPVLGGVSGAAVFRVEVSDRRYVLRIEGPPSPLRNPHQYESMRIAASAGIAPPVHFTDAQAGIAVMDFVAAQPLSAYPGGPRALSQAIGSLLARVQTTPPFPHFVTYPQIVGRLWAHVVRTGLFATGILDAHTERLGRICETYSWDQDGLVSSHNDLLPRNVLFDGRRLWLIDWESAYRNDPLVDVATAVDNFAATPDLEAVLLQSWRGAPLDARSRERLELVRALTRLYYAGVLFSASAAAKWRSADDSLTAPSVVEFERLVRAGRLSPGTSETTHVLGKMYLSAFLTGHAPPGLPPPISHFQI